MWSKSFSMRFRGLLGIGSFGGNDGCSPWFRAADGGAGAGVCRVSDQGFWTLPALRGDHLKAGARPAPPACARWPPPQRCGCPCGRGVSTGEEFPRARSFQAVSPESLELVGGWLASCDSTRALKPKPTNHPEPTRNSKRPSCEAKNGKLPLSCLCHVATPPPPP
jgi:hypothetical protein